jgi:hypothetical protein
VSDRDELLLGEAVVVTRLRMGSERLRLFFTQTRIILAHIGKRGVGSPAMGSFFGGLSGALEDLFRSGRESVSKRGLKTLTPGEILAADKDNFSINYQDVVSVDVDLAAPLAHFTILTKDDKYHFIATGPGDVLLDLLRKVMGEKVKLA